MRTMSPAEIFATVDARLAAEAEAKRIDKSRTNELWDFMGEASPVDESNLQISPRKPAEKIRPSSKSNLKEVLEAAKSFDHEPRMVDGDFGNENADMNDHRYIHDEEHEKVHDTDTADEHASMDGVMPSPVASDGNKIANSLAA